MSMFKNATNFFETSKEEQHNFCISYETLWFLRDNLPFIKFKICNYFNKIFYIAYEKKIYWGQKFQPKIEILFKNFGQSSNITIICITRLLFLQPKLNSFQNSLSKILIKNGTAFKEKPIAKSMRNMKISEKYFDSTELLLYKFWQRKYNLTKNRNFSKKFNFYKKKRTFYQEGKCLPKTVL